MRDVFRYFIRKNWRNVGLLMTNYEIDKLGIEFHFYLNNKLNGEQKAEIVSKDLVGVLFNLKNPSKKNGFHPDYAIHFNDFLIIVNKRTYEEMV